MTDETPEVCRCCEAEPPNAGTGSLGKNCFMIWYDSGITDAAKLGKESKWRRENGHWPWGKTIPKVADLETLHSTPE